MHASTRNLGGIGMGQPSRCFRCSSLLMTISSPQLQRMILTGFMGSGKTTVGQLLAARLGWSFADLDGAVERRQGLSVPEIFAQQGEPAFRVAEVEALAALLGQRGVVIALGGGAAATPAVRELLLNTPHTAVVHLHAEFDVLQDRCLRQALDPATTARPLIQDEDAARLRYLERAPLYAALAHHRIDVSTASPANVVEDILAAWAILADSRPR